MKTKLKNLKGSPLLGGPPAETLPEWLRVSKEDIRLFDKEVAVRTKNRDGLGLATMYYYMKGLGIDETPTQEQVKHMMNTLGKARIHHIMFRDWDIAELLYYMKGINLHPNVTGNDRKLMAKTLADARERKDDHYIGLQHRFMQGLGEEQDVTPTDKEIMLKHLENARKSSWWIAQSHIHLRSAGVDTHVTEDDVKKIKEDVRHNRNIQSGHTLAETLYYARILLNPAENDAKTKLPLLKEYVK